MLIIFYEIFFVSFMFVIPTAYFVYTTLLKRIREVSICPQPLVGRNCHLINGDYEYDYLHLIKTNVLIISNK